MVKATGTGCFRKGMQCLSCDLSPAGKPESRHESDVLAEWTTAWPGVARKITIALGHSVETEASTEKILSHRAYTEKSEITIVSCFTLIRPTGTTIHLKDQLFTPIRSLLYLDLNRPVPSLQLVD